MKRKKAKPDEFESFMETLLGQLLSLPEFPLCKPRKKTYVDGQIDILKSLLHYYGVFKGNKREVLISWNEKNLTKMEKL